MASSAADRNLLFGLLALQIGLIDQAQLVAAFQGWTLKQDRPLAEHLLGRGDLDADDRAAVEALVARHLKKHGGSAEKSLAAIGAGRSTRASLARVGGPEIEQTLGHLGSGSAASLADGEDGRTASYAVGAATSDGQRFRVLRPHAKGGLGAVFVALDAELHREVALKQILDRHADDPVSRARFVLEAEITGGLEHPGIVPVYGLGKYDDGRPYYAMRFIRGDSLKEAIDRFHADETTRSDPGRRMLELHKLLRQFTDVCNAIDYAHSRGVLHRDLKPGNIIVGKHGETLVVDWGLAKALGRSEPGVDSGERTLVPSSSSGSSETLPGSALGTPAYMSPEQADGDIAHLGPRSDVYSLGATLYCLLTGRPPHEGDVGEVLRAVQRGEVRPPRQLDPTIDRALDAVCMKAMAHKAADRYGSPRAMAEDVERWMADEPVSAWREPLSRRARRWGRRHRTAVTAGLAAVLVALAGTGAVLAVQTRANGELKRANVDLAVANDRVIRSNADLKAASERERQRFDLAMEAIKLFHGEVSEDLLLKEKEFAGLRARLLKGAAGFYGKLEGLLKAQADPKSMAALGRAYFELGELTQKIGNSAEALAVHRKGLAVRRELAARPGADGEAVLDVARSRYAEGTLLYSIGNTAAGLESYEDARALADGLIAAGHGSDEARFLLAMCLNSISNRRATLRPGESLEEARQALSIMEELVGSNPLVTRYQEELSSCHHSMAIAYSAMGRPADALAANHEGLEIQQRLADAQPLASSVQNTLARYHVNIAAELEGLGRSVEAAESRRRGVAMWQKAVDANPAVTTLQNNLAFGLDALAYDLNRLGRPAEALEELARARSILQRLYNADHGTTAYPRNLATNYRYTADALERMGALREVDAAIDKAVAFGQEMADAQPTNLGFRQSVADTLSSQGWRRWRTGRAAEAIATFDRERPIWQNMVATDPGNASYCSGLANCETNMAAALIAMGRPAEARGCCDRAIAIRQALVSGAPASDGYNQGLAESLLRSGTARRAAGDSAGAAADWRRAAALYASHPPPGGEPALLRACCHGALAGLAGADGSAVSSAEGTAQAEEAMAILRRAVAGGYRDFDLIRVESGLDSLRSRDDFRLMMMDLGFPAAPLAITGWDELISRAIGDGDLPPPRSRPR